MLGECPSNALTLQRLNMLSTSDLPAVNASLNAISTIFISAGWYFIRRNFWQRHVACMITAIISSTLFLAGYLTYHAQVGEKSSGYRGWLATVYFPMLASHVLLAFITLPLVILTLVPVFQRRWDKRRPGLPDALSMVSAAESCTATLNVVCSCCGQSAPKNHGHDRNLQRTIESETSP
jgi:putative membrane protein